MWQYFCLFFFFFLGDGAPLVTSTCYYTTYWASTTLPDITTYWAATTYPATATYWSISGSQSYPATTTYWGVTSYPVSKAYWATTAFPVSTSTCQLQTATVTSKLPAARQVESDGDDTKEDDESIEIEPRDPLPSPQSDNAQLLLETSF